MIEEWEERERTETVTVPSRLEIEDATMEGWLDRYEGLVGPDSSAELSCTDDHAV